MDRNLIGVIKLGKNTAGHAEWLRGKGYEVSEAEGKLNVKVSRFVSDDIDLSGSVEDSIKTLSAIAAEGAAISYSTKVKFADGKVLFGVPACTRLGKASALVMASPKAAAAKAEGFTF